MRAAPILVVKLLQDTTPRLREHLMRRFPGYHVRAIDPLAPDTGATRDSTAKAAGYGRPVRVSLENAAGETLQVVWRVAIADELGHDRRADRAANTLLAFDDFGAIPEHIAALDVGAVRADGELVSLRDAGELYLITSYAPGTIYAEDLRRIARDGAATELDVARVDALAAYLAKLHVPIDAPLRYRRAVRDLIGHGEGVFGIVDSYPQGVHGAGPDRLRAIERACADWRWRLREHEGRLTRTHGDFHPFNVVFDRATHFTCLDASRGACGEPADDVTAMAVNFLLFALDRPSAWQHGLGRLWHRFWRAYREARPDPSLTAVAPPFFAWRALVVCNPRFYPGLSGAGRDALLGLAETALSTGHIDPAWADEVFA
jgi:hypothetical protein